MHLLFLLFLLFAVFYLLKYRSSLCACVFVESECWVHNRNNIQQTEKRDCGEGQINAPTGLRCLAQRAPNLWELVRKGSTSWTHWSLLLFLPYSLICSPSAPVSSDRSVSSSSSPDEMASAQSNHGYCHHFATRIHAYTIACSLFHAGPFLQICTHKFVKKLLEWGPFFFFKSGHMLL